MVVYQPLAGPGCIFNSQLSNMIFEADSGCLRRVEPAPNPEPCNEDEAAAYGGALPPKKEFKLPSTKRELCNDGITLVHRGGLSNPKRSKLVPRLLACPFAKHNMGALMHHSCYGRGFENVARVKEHLRRAHVSPPYCLRCHRIFGYEELKEHQLQAEPCKVQPKPAEFGRMWLSDRALTYVCRRKQRGQPEAEAWRAIYRLCFEDAETDLSPYLDDDPQPHWLPITASAFEHLSQSIAKSLFEKLSSQRVFGVAEGSEELEAIQTTVFQCVRDATSQAVVGGVCEEDVEARPSVSYNASSASSDSGYQPLAMSKSHETDSVASAARLQTSFLPDDVPFSFQGFDASIPWTHQAASDADSAYGSEMAPCFALNIPPYIEELKPSRETTCSSRTHGSLDNCSYNCAADDPNVGLRPANDSSLWFLGSTSHSFNWLGLEADEFFYTLSPSISNPVL